MEDFMAEPVAKQMKKAFLLRLCFYAKNYFCRILGSDAQLACWCRRGLL
jgi:hypothetical protein